MKITKILLASLVIAAIATTISVGYAKNHRNRSVDLDGNHLDKPGSSKKEKIRTERKELVDNFRDDTEDSNQYTPEEREEKGKEFKKKFKELGEKEAALGEKEPVDQDKEFIETADTNIDAFESSIRALKGKGIENLKAAEKANYEIITKKVEYIKKLKEEHKSGKINGEEALNKFDKVKDIK